MLVWGLTFSHRRTALKPRTWRWQQKERTLCETLKKKKQKQQQQNKTTTKKESLGEGAVRKSLMLVYVAWMLQCMYDFVHTAGESYSSKICLHSIFLSPIVLAVADDGLCLFEIWDLLLKMDQTVGPCYFHLSVCSQEEQSAILYGLDLLIM